jgi:hypothetical protein
MIRNFDGAGVPTSLLGQMVQSVLKLPNPNERHFGVLAPGGSVVTRRRISLSFCDHRTLKAPRSVLPGLRSGRRTPVGDAPWWPPVGSAWPPPGRSGWPPTGPGPCGWPSACTEPTHQSVRLAITGPPKDAAHDVLGVNIDPAARGSSPLHQNCLSRPSRGSTSHSQIKFLIATGT